MPSNIAFYTFKTKFHVVSSLVQAKDGNKITTQKVLKCFAITAVGLRFKLFICSISGVQRKEFLIIRPTQDPCRCVYMGC